MAVIKIPELKGLVAGEYGKTNSVTLKDFDGTAQDISSYTGLDVVFRSPGAIETSNPSRASPNPWPLALM